jgi:hypothetical protein
MLLVNVLVKEGHVKHSVGQEKENVLHIQQKQYRQNIFKPE